MTTVPRCLNCGAPVPLPFLLCPTCREQSWSDGPHHLSGDELALSLGLRHGERCRAPAGWWQGEEGLEHGAALLRWYVQRELGTNSRDAVLAVACLRTLGQARLSSWLNNQMRPLSVFDAFQLAFPELELRPWELLGQVPRHYWDEGGDEARVEAIRWWLERLGLSAHEVLVQLEIVTNSIAFSDTRCSSSPTPD